MVKGKAVNRMNGLKRGKRVRGRMKGSIKGVSVNEKQQIWKASKH